MTIVKYVSKYDFTHLMLILVVRFQSEGYKMKIRKIIGQEHRRKKYEGSFQIFLRPISYLGVICFKPENQSFL